MLLQIMINGKYFFVNNKNFWEEYSGSQKNKKI